MRSIHTVEYYSARKRNELPIYATMWMNLKNIMKSERRPRIVWLHLYELSRIGGFIASEGRLVFARGWEKERMGSDCFNRCTGFSFGAKQIFLKSIKTTL